MIIDREDPVHKEGYIVSEVHIFIGYQGHLKRFKDVGVSMYVKV